MLQHPHFLLSLSLLLLGCKGHTSASSESKSSGTESQSGGSDVGGSDDGGSDDGGSDDDGATGEVETLADLRYPLPSGVDDSTATLDLFRLDDGLARPLVVLIHGGSWVGGDKSNFADAAPDFVPFWIKQGFTVAALNFRLATPVGTPREVGPLEQAHDIAHAITWLAAEGEALGISEDPVIAVGYSSGAHLVALLGADGHILTDAGATADILRATVSLDVHAYDVPYALELMVDSDVEENIPLMEHLFGTTETEQLAGSPIAFVDSPTAPALLVSVGPRAEVGSHGDIVARTAEHYATALLAAGHDVQTFHDEAETHTSLAVGFGDPDDPTTAAVEAFLSGLP